MKMILILLLSASLGTVSHAQTAGSTKEKLSAQIEKEKKALTRQKLIDLMNQKLRPAVKRKYCKKSGSGCKMASGLNVIQLVATSKKETKYDSVYDVERVYWLSSEQYVCEVITVNTCVQPNESWCTGPVVSDTVCAEQ